MVCTLALDLHERSLAETNRSRKIHLRYGRYSRYLAALIIETIGRSSIDITLVVRIVQQDFFIHQLTPSTGCILTCIVEAPRTYSRRSTTTVLSILIDGYKRIILEIIEDQHIRQRQRTTTRCMDQDPRMSSFLTSRLRLVNAYILITSIVPPSCRITSCKFITVVNLPCSRYSCFHITRQRFRFYAGRTQIGLSLAIRISKTISHILGTRRTRRCQNLFTDILCQCTATVCMNHCIDELTPILILIEVVCRSQTYMVPNVVLRRSNGTSKATHFDLRELEFQLKICRSDIFRSREFGHRNIGSTMSVFVNSSLNFPGPKRPWQ